jgi:hypothetical protein
MAKKEFIEQLEALGYQVEDLPGQKIAFVYKVLNGGNTGLSVRIGLDNTNTFPMDTPPGPHFQPITQGWKEHPQNVRESPFHDGHWRYWSRPFPEWNRTERTVSVYLSHIRRILSTV